MTRLIRPSSFFTGRYFLACPDCFRVRWGSGRCQCGARLLGPWRNGAILDPTRRNWLIDADGTAKLVQA